jgi:mono/diheme cytochrome c family protein
VREQRRLRFVQRGGRVYRDRCLRCHGEAGDGRGPAAAFLLTKPRDFRQGTFKFRSTKGGTLPTDDDLRGVIRRGIPYTSMPPFGDLSDRDVRATTAYLKTFSSRWGRAESGPTIQIAARPPDAGTREAVAKGRAAYTRAACVNCHGPRGDAKGVLAGSLIDDWGHATRPADFTLGMYKSGPAPVDAVRTIVAGLNGTAMASFAEVLDPGEPWYLADYLRSLARPVATVQHRVALLLEHDYPDEFARHVGAPTAATSVTLALAGARLDNERPYRTPYLRGGVVLPLASDPRSNDWYVALFARPQDIAPAATVEPELRFLDDDGRPNADGLAAIMHLRTWRPHDATRAGGRR